MRLFRAGTAILDDCLAALFTPTCVVCDELSGKFALCSSCFQYREVTAPVCFHCGRTMPVAAFRCGKCQEDSSVTAIRSQYWLDKVAKEVIHKIKYERYFELLELFICRLSTAQFAWLPPGISGVIPVPIHYDRWIERSFNQSAFLARSIASLLSIPFLENSLIKCRPTRPQSLLAESKRKKNLSAVFTWEGDSPPPSVLVIDDVYTTGATLEAAGKILINAGCPGVYGWTLFRTPSFIDS